MLEELHVRALALIDEVWLEFSPGLNVLSGETGAGKTALVEALKLLLGERADSTLVRSGSEEALVAGRFTIDGMERVAKRRVSSEGRSKCLLDGEMASVGELADQLGGLVDLHGQHAHQALLRPAAHAGYLDRFGGEPLLLAVVEYEAAFEAAREATNTRMAIEEALSEREREMATLESMLEDIGGVVPVAGEDERLSSELPRLRHGERLAVASSSAYRSIRSEGSASDSLGAALEVLHSVAGIDARLDAMRSQLETASALVEEVAPALRAYGEDCDHDAEALESTESRLAALEGLKRRYGPTLSDVLGAAEDAKERLALLGAGEERLEAARAVESEAERRLLDAAEQLTRRRRDAAGPFVERLGAACADLAMGGASFEVEIDEAKREGWGPHSPGRVEFLYRAAPGEEARPLAKIASGGEASRVMLALKGVLGHADRTPVLVFDEVDSGVGGATAVAVGERLKQLAQVHQVIVVTHLAQVAAFADNHLVVEKAMEGDRAVTRVRRVSGDERLAELARMLSGSDTLAGMTHAEELLEAARGVGSGVDA